MSTAVESLKDWFDNKLNREQQEEVLKFLYDSKVLLRKDQYFGPDPGFFTKGLHCGPAPLASSLNQSTARVCPTCRRPL